MNKKIISTIRKLFKGSEGESEVVESLVEILRKSGDENYYLVPKATIADLGGSKEIDLLLLHPVFGLYVIEVKAWEKFYIDTKNDPFKQANKYQDMLLSRFKEEFKKIPINIEYRVIFPYTSKKEAEEFFEHNKYYANFSNHAFFKEDLEGGDIFGRFFNSSVSIIPNKKEFLQIAKMVVPQEKIASKNIIPIITNDEIVFFDHKQLSILNGYTGGFRIIRGVAGTGKTVILTNFVANRLKRYDDERFLILCFNRKLADELENSFTKVQKRNIDVFSIFEFLKRIGFEEEAVGITKETSFEQKYEIFESTEALKEFRAKLRNYLQSHPYDYFLCDETQDQPAGFIRMIYEEINDAILFIDEAQRFYPYTMKSIADVFHHPKFKEKISMRGRVKNLKNVYRTPSNIAKCAFEILAFDKSINDYYKRSYYIKDTFLDDINCVLEDGSIAIESFDDFEKLKILIEKFSSNQETTILTYTKKSVEAIKKVMDSIGRGDVKVMTMASVKGLESQNILIHNFGNFLAKSAHNNNDIFYRQIYVLLTRAQNKLYLSIPNEEELLDMEKASGIIKVLRRYTEVTQHKVILQEEEENTIRLAKIKPVIENVKEGAELIVTASELFGVIAGLFTL